MLSLAIDCDGAAGRVTPPLAGRLRAFAGRQDEAFRALNRDQASRGGFAASFDKATGRPAEANSALWQARAGSPTTAQIAMLCVARYDYNGKTAYRDCITNAANAYLISTPSPETDVWPGTFGHAISLELAAWRHTAQADYLNCARRLGMLAVETFWQKSPLPSAGSRCSHYETITGADTLALALTELHLQILHITAVVCPSNTIDR